MLEDVLAGVYTPSKKLTKHRLEMETAAETQEAEQEEPDEAVWQGRQFVPVNVISYVSPTLSQLASPYGGVVRQEARRAGLTPLHSTPCLSRPAVKRKAESSGGRSGPGPSRLSLSPTSRPLRLDLDHKLDSLKVGLRNDIEQDIKFERMLQAAMK